MAFTKVEQDNEELIVEKDISTKERVNVTHELQRLEQLATEYNRVVDKLTTVKTDTSEDFVVPKKI